ncbi:MAG: adaptor protein MecA [Eubacteriales bacterium]|nr:adaptor protein MecA [Eubacteriales bacterium]
MKIEKVTQNKIKITLSDYDMSAWKLDIHKISTNSPEAREFFWSIIQRAESELDFTVKDSQLLVEANVNTTGSIIHISKVSPDTKECDNINRYQIKRVALRAKDKSSSDKTYIVEFEQFDDLIEASKLLSLEYKEKSSAYKYKDKYYLEIKCNYDCSKRMIIKMSDFGRIIDNHTILKGKLNEYGELLIKTNAIPSLSRL